MFKIYIFFLTFSCTVVTTVDILSCYQITVCRKRVNVWNIICSVTNAWKSKLLQGFFKQLFDREVCHNAFFFFFFFPDPMHVVNQWFMPGGSMKLTCPSSSNLATTKWEVNGRLVTSSPRHEILQNELLILNVSDSDAGRYRCLSVERSKADEYTATVAEYQLSLKVEPRSPQAQRNGSSTVGLQVVIGLLVVSLVALLAWNFYNGHLPLPWNCNKKQSGKSYESNGQEDPGPL